MSNTKVFHKIISYPKANVAGMIEAIVEHGEKGWEMCGIDSDDITRVIFLKQKTDIPV